MPTSSPEDEEDDDYLSEEVHSSGSSGDESPPHPPTQNYFAPPFYGRPPTPLPPSPSLTSLLRPSRPTTPDASDDDALAPLPRAAPKVPTYEYYGFVLYLFSSLTFLMYLLWSYLPSPFLHALGIYYYPNRWWALATPAFLVMALVYIYVALASYNTEMLTVPMSSAETVVDGAGKTAVVDSKGRLKALAERGSGHGHGHGNGHGHGHRHRHEHVGTREQQARKLDKDGRLNWREVWNEGTDAVLDVPLGGVCEVLYGEGREDPGEENW